ncbi:MAG: ribonuclease HII [Puniceicoccales bacterium]|jgi:ribonuclease HII|nr:ribonuclease HII [Puniceicoccales bacterium]
MNERIAFDRETISNYAHLIGVDEAGRGPLAGPVAVGAVKISRNFLQRMDEFPFLSEVNDSKKLSPKKREVLFKYFFELRRQKLLQFTLSLRDHKIIDKINILEATTRAMNDAIGRLSGPHAKILVDGKFVKNLRFDHCAIPKGDGKSFCIAAASIIAKVIRDRLMNYFSKKYSQYGFERHKGYGTAMHIDALKCHGPSPIHRLTFCKHFFTSPSEA